MYFVGLRDVGDAPVDIQAELQARLREVAATVASIPQDHTFWAKVQNHDLQIDISGWRFFYRVDQAAQRLEVVRGTLRAIA